MLRSLYIVHPPEKQAVVINMMLTLVFNFWFKASRDFSNQEPGALLMHSQNKIP